MVRTLGSHVHPQSSNPIIPLNTLIDTNYEFLIIQNSKSIIHQNNQHQTPFEKEHPNRGLAHMYPCIFPIFLSNPLWFLRALPALWDLITLCLEQTTIELLIGNPAYCFHIYVPRINHMGCSFAFQIKANGWTTFTNGFELGVLTNALLLQNFLCPPFATTMSADLLSFVCNFFLTYPNKTKNLRLSLLWYHLKGF